MDSITAEVFPLNSSTGKTLDQCVSLSFEKERYTPYTQARGTFICNIQPGEITKIRIYINGKAVHYGPIDTARQYTAGGIGYFTFFSRGFSMGLSQNHLEPGLKFSADLNSIVKGSAEIPYVTFESNTGTVNYIYVKDNSSIWDGVVAFSQKKSGQYPYISGPNHVRHTPDSSSRIAIENESICESGRGSSYTSAISHIHMKDTEDAYSFNYADSAAIQRELVRHKYINLDRQWLGDPEGGLAHKAKFSVKGMNYLYVKCAGYVESDLRRKASFSGKICGETFGEREVSKILVTLNKNGIFTTLWFYTDGYS